MKRFFGALGKALKVMVYAIAASVGRIARQEGRGVFETAVQNAAREIANSYLSRSVNA
jgi:hypothetical protein